MNGTRTRRRWPRRFWDPDAFDAVCRTNGAEPEEVEYDAGLKSGRLDELAENGWQPYVWEVAHMADVLGLSMDDLYDEAFPEQG